MRVADALFTLPDKNNEEERDPQFIMSLARGLELLRTFDPSLGPLGNKELSERTGLPKPTISRLTHTLTRLGYLEYIDRLSKYQLGPAVLGLGYAYLSHLDVRAVARPFLQDLANEFDMSVGLGCRDRLDMVYLDIAQGANIRTIRMDVGSHVPIAKTAMGMALLAAVPKSERDFLTAAIKKHMPKEWSQARKTIQRTKKEMDDLGFCVVCSLYNRNINGVAVPYMSADGTSVLSINCSAPAYQIEESVFYEQIGPRLHDLVRNLETEARRLSRR
jgi:DNA-binding IclR family transcriptional regulator